jgi:hypothetical protein
MLSGVGRGRRSCRNTTQQGDDVERVAGAGSEELTYSLDWIPPRDRNARRGIDMRKRTVVLSVNNAFNQRKPTEYFYLLSFRRGTPAFRPINH